MKAVVRLRFRAPRRADHTIFVPCTPQKIRITFMCFENVVVLHATGVGGLSPVKENDICGWGLTPLFEQDPDAIPVVWAMIRLTDPHLRSDGRSRRHLQGDTQLGRHQMVGNPAGQFTSLFEKAHFAMIIRNGKQVPPSARVASKEDVGWSLRRCLWT